MSNKLFAKEEVRILSKNKYVNNINMKAITYIKKIGFDINILEIERVRSYEKCWRDIYKKDGVCELTDKKIIFRSF